MSTHTVTTTNIGIITGLPSKYKVILLNDNFTPVDFVIALLIDVFGKNEDDATDVTWQVHHYGKGIAGVYYHELAEQKVQEATRYSRKSGFPLILYAEEE
jgi:ATP-dependent Clp protease adaptor protein ClpS